MLKLFENIAVLDAYHNFFFNNNKKNIEKLRKISKQMLGKDIIEIVEKVTGETKQKNDGN